MKKISNWSDKTKNRIIRLYFGLTLIALLGVGLYAFFIASIPGFVDHPMGSVQDKEAEENMDHFQRGHLNFKNKRKAVIYDIDALQSFIDTTRKVLIPRHQEHFGNANPPAGYVWKIGLYWMEKRDVDNKIKHDVYFLPVLVSKDQHTNKSTVLDYFDENNKKYYRRSKEDEKLVPGNVFDTGEIWP
jgi:hypothetical protein